jgi:hypothetical protein
VNDTRPEPSISEERVKKAQEQIADMCMKAFADGYQKGFSAGVAAAMGLTPANPNEKLIDA